MDKITQMLIMTELRNKPELFFLDLKILCCKKNYLDLLLAFGGKCIKMMFSEVLTRLRNNQNRDLVKNACNVIIVLLNLAAKCIIALPLLMQFYNFSAYQDKKNLLTENYNEMILPCEMVKKLLIITHLILIYILSQMRCSSNLKLDKQNLHKTLIYI
jgi:hypothetical protein